MGALDVATIVLEADASQVAVARRFVRHHAGAAADPDVVGDLQLIVSELFTNAVEHGSADEVTVTVESGDDDIAVTVHSSGPAEVGPVREWSMAAPEEITGRGLGIVRDLADELLIDRSTDAFVVTARRSLRERAGA